MVKFTFSKWQEQAEGIKKRKIFIKDYYFVIRKYKPEWTINKIEETIAEETGYDERTIRRIVNGK